MTTDVTFVAGDDITLTITAQDQDGTAIDITGATINWKLVNDKDSSDTVTKATGGSGIALTTPASGIFTVTLTDVDTTSLSGRYTHEAKITDTGGLITRLRKSDMSPASIKFDEKIVS